MSIRITLLSRAVALDGASAATQPVNAGGDLHPRRPVSGLEWRCLLRRLQDSQAALRIARGGTESIRHRAHGLDSISIKLNLAEAYILRAERLARQLAGMALTGE